MKRIFKQSAIAIAIIGLAGSGYAGTLTGAFIGGEGLDLQPRNGDQDFITVLPSTTPGVISTSALHSSYSWGFRIFAGLNFCGGEDLTVSWLRFHTNNTNNFPNAFSTPGDLLTSNPRFLYSSTWADVFDKISYDLDEVYAVFGHTMNMGPWAFRLAGGAEWARLNSNMEVNGFDTSDELFAGNQATSQMHGIGPRVEIDMTYNLPMNLSLFARTNLAMLIASRQIALNAFDPDEFNDFTWSTRHVVVPKVGIKLGVGYNFAFGNMGGEGAAGMGSALTLEAGWQADSYIHAVERPEGFGNTDTNVFAANLQTRTSNYGVEGLFLGAKLSTGWF